MNLTCNRILRREQLFSLIYICCLIGCWPVVLHAQIVIGPNNPSGVANNLSGGTVPWNTPDYASVSDNQYAIASNGLTNLLRASGMGFLLPNNAILSGVLVEVERRAAPVNPVVGSGWITRIAADYPGSGTTTARYGTTNYSYDLPTPAGNNRMLVVTIGIENVDNPTSSGDALNPAIALTSVTFNGVPMVQAAFSQMASATTGNNVAIYYLLEANLPATTGTYNLVINKTIVGETGGANGTITSSGEYIEVVGMNTFSHVNQITPILANSATSSTSPLTTAAFNHLRGGDLVVAATMNNTPNTSGNITPGIGFTEHFEISRSNPPTNTGINFQLQSRAIPTGTTTAASSITATGHSRLVMCAVAIISARVYDNSVRLTNDAGNEIGNNNAIAPPQVLSNAWPDTDTYVSYAGLTDLWGATLTPAIVNDADFGLNFQVNAQDAIAFIDHIRITIQYDILLTAHLRSFSVQNSPECIKAYFDVTTTTGSSYTYTLQKSINGSDFIDVAALSANGNGTLQSFSLCDPTPVNTKVSYYRLRITTAQSDDTFSKVVAYQNNEVMAEVQVYPNPSSKVIFIQHLDHVPLSVHLNDISGRVYTVLPVVVNTGVYRVELPEDLPGGNYLLTILTRDNRVITKKLLIQKSIKK